MCRRIIEKREWILTGFIVILLFAYYSVLLDSPFYGDDIYNSCIRGNLNELGVSIWRFMWEQNAGWMHGGRVFPLAELQYLVFYIFNRISCYKMYLVIFTLLDIGLFAAVVKEISGSHYFMNMAMVVSGICMPVYTYGGVNPMSMFGGLVQFVMLLGLSAVYFQIRYYRTQKYYNLVVSAILAACAMLTYEPGWSFPMILFLLAGVYAQGQNKILAIFKDQIPNFVICGCVAIFNIIWRFCHTDSVYEGVKANLEPAKIWKAFKVQFLGSIPFFNWKNAAKPAYLFQHVSDCFLHIDVQTAAIVVGLVILLMYNLKNGENKVEDRRKCVLSFGLIGSVLWLVPAILISVSEKYQRELEETNLPYLPFFMGIFGMSLLYLLVILMIHRKEIKMAANIFLLMLILIIPPVYRYSVILSNQNDRLLYKDTREILVDATENGLFDETEDDAVIVLDQRYVPTVSCNVFSMVDKNLKTNYYLYQSDIWIRNYKDLGGNGAGELDCSDTSVYMVKAYVTDQLNIVISGRVQKVGIDENCAINGIYCDDVKLYIRMKEASAAANFMIISKDQNMENTVPINLKDYMNAETLIKQKNDASDYMILFQEHLYDYERFIF